jgi:hypothetical protein
MAAYRFVSVWHLEAPLQQVYDAVVDSLHWPDWWPGVESVREVVPGDADGIGDVRHYVWKSPLPYRLCFDARTVRVVPACRLEATVGGDLEGCGCWSFAHADGVTVVQYDWKVRTTRRWMNWLAPLARPVFAANHHGLMRRGAIALARRLGARLLRAESAEPPGSHAPGDASWLRGALAGIGAGTIATLVQLVLWWSASYEAIGMLLRDTRFAAAIALGPSVLPPPVDFDWRIFLVAGLVHGMLSVLYGTLAAPLLTRLPLRSALAGGALYGLLIYAVNMYGFTALFPWFSASRDWITAGAHLAFGLSLAVITKSWDTVSRASRGQ